MRKNSVAISACSKNTDNIRVRSVLRQSLIYMLVTILETFLNTFGQPFEVIFHHTNLTCWLYMLLYLFVTNFDFEEFFITLPNELQLKTTISRKGKSLKYGGIYLSVKKKYSRCENRIARRNYVKGLRKSVYLCFQAVHRL